MVPVWPGGGSVENMRRIALISLSTHRPPHKIAAANITKLTQAGKARILRHADARISARIAGEGPSHQIGQMLKMM